MTSENEQTDPGTTQAAKASRNRRKTVIGEVVSDKMQKTISVRVQRLERHRRYHKFVRRRTTYKAHDAREEAQVGDLVRITEARPLSKTKRWRLVEVVKRAGGAPLVGNTTEDSSGNVAESTS